MAIITAATTPSDFAMVKRLFGAYRREAEPLTEAAGVCT
jgi:hypothetical protein